LPSMLFVLVLVSILVPVEFAVAIENAGPFSNATSKAPSNATFGQHCRFPVDCNSENCVACACVNGECKCGGGWSGNNCTTPFCRDRLSCSGHGDCSMSRQNVSCICDEGFEGERCEKVKCDLNCKHGGEPDSQCSQCIGCLGAWTGRTCEGWNESVPISVLKEELQSFVDGSRAQMEENVKKFRAICQSNQECVGFGANDITNSIAALPVVRLTYLRGHTAGKYTFPDQAEVRRHQNPTVFDVDTQVFPDMETFTNFVDSQYRSQSKGAIDIYAQSYADVFKKYFQYSDDRGLTVTRGMLNFVDMSLPVDPVSKQYDLELERHVKYFIQSLGPYSKRTKSLYKFFIEQYGTSFVTSSTSGGMLATTSKWRTLLTIVERFTNDDLAVNGRNDFHKTWGVGSNSSYMPSYSENTIVDKLAWGGDVSAKTTAEWETSLRSDPGLWALLGFRTYPTMDLIEDEQIRGNFSLAIQDLIREERTKWNEESKCPLTCNNAGKCLNGKSCSCFGRFGRSCSIQGKYEWLDRTDVIGRQTMECAGNGQVSGFRSYKGDGDWKIIGLPGIECQQMPVGTGEYYDAKCVWIAMPTTQEGTRYRSCPEGSYLSGFSNYQYGDPMYDENAVGFKCCTPARQKLTITNRTWVPVSEPVLSGLLGLSAHYTHHVVAPCLLGGPSGKTQMFATGFRDYCEDKCEKRAEGWPYLQCAVIENTLP